MVFLAKYLMQGRLQAVSVASACVVLSLVFPPIHIVSSASVALVTLRLGAIEGGYVIIGSTLIGAVAGFFLIGSYQFSVFYALMLWLPTWVLAVVLREYRHLCLTIELAVIIVSIAIVLGYFFQPDLAAFWKMRFNSVLEPVLVQSNPQADLQTIQHALSVFYRFIITGLVAQIYVLGLLAGLFLGRWWQAMLYNPGGFAKDYLAIKGQSFLALITGFVLFISVLSNGLVPQIGWAIGLLLFTLYALIGAAVVHGLLITLKVARWIVPCFYVTLLIVPYAMMLVSLIGLIDTWLNLRNKIPNKSSI